MGSVSKYLWLVPAFLIAPVDLGARPPVQKNVRVAPAPGEPAYVKGLKIRARIRSAPGKPLVVAMKGINPYPRPVTARVKIQVMERPEGSRFARMAPMPRERAATTVMISMGPNEKVERTVAFDAIKVRSKKSARRMYARVIQVSSKKIARAADTGPSPRRTFRKRARRSPRMLDRAGMKASLVRRANSQVAQQAAGR